MTRIVVDVLMAAPQSARWRWPTACHLFHLDSDLAALDAFAASIGMRRSWRHDAPGFIHYDLHPNTRARAVAAGAREVSRRDPEYVAYIRGRAARAAAGTEQAK